MSLLTPPTVDRLRQQIASAFERGADTQVLSLLQALCRQCPDDAEAHYRLGVIEEQIGSPAGAREAYLQCVRLAPTNPTAYLYAGYCLQQQGLQRAALDLYSMGAELDERLLYLWQSNQQPLESQQRSAAASQALRGHLTMLHAQAVGDAEDCQRVAAAIWTRTHNAPLQFRVPQQQPQLFYLPGITASGFVDASHWPWAKQLQAAANTIQQELLQALPHIRAQGRPYLAAGTVFDEAFAPLVGSLDWTALDLFTEGVAHPALTGHFPETLAALRHAPLYGLDDNPFEVFFSLLRPGQHIKPHYGLSNHSLTVHLPLVLPQACWLRVGDETRQWHTGQITVFDDTFIHEACNDSDAERIVLIFSIWHPDLTRAEQQAIKRTFRARQQWLAQRQLPKLQ
ncbi:MAG: aspartyl/asparaginyl beta-hydroxylase domain-containing protein [Pseudomonadales bacterium]|nr:aspartyl/asparaginyl beta-hydroxylase domain-containing protein [Pseudomonadales bacterium]MDP4641423.1 aspartyl/asparaginyl beta-hydroxylase domain-containing protein [Pseudomonadales bacterium]